MSDTNPQTIDFNNNGQSLLIHIDNNGETPISVTGDINTTLTKITEPVEIRTASTDLDMLKSVALQLYTYADFEKIQNRVDYGVLCFERAYDYVRAFHIFLDRKNDQ